MKAGLRGSIGTIGLLGVSAGLAATVILTLVPLGILSLLNAVIGALAVAILLLTTIVVRRFRRERRASAAIDFVASRLLSVESRLSALDRPPEPNRSADLADITSDITLLSGLVKSLAEALSAQDHEIEELKGRLDRLADQPVPVAPPPRVSPEHLGLSVSANDRIRSGADRSRAERQTSTELTRDTISARDVNSMSASAPAPARIIPSLLPVMDDQFAQATRAGSEVDPVASEARRTAIVEALMAERIELHLQPIVSLPQRRTRFYEVLARLRLADDTLLSPAEFMPPLERLGRLPQMDRIVVARALVIAASLASRDSDVRLTCNLSPPSLRDPSVMTGLENLLSERPDLASRLVFEIPQRIWRALSVDTAASLERLRALGVAFALDHATDLRFDGIVLGEKGVTFVKLPADMLLEASRAGDDPGPIGQLLSLLAKRGVQVVVERVEREAEIPDLLDLDVALAQGFALGAPRAVRPDLAIARQPARVAPVDVPAPPIEPAGGDEPARPFRSFLRRTA